MSGGITVASAGRGHSDHRNHHHRSAGPEPSFPQAPGVLACAGFPGREGKLMSASRRRRCHAHAQCAPCIAARKPPELPEEGAAALDEQSRSVGAGTEDMSLRLTMHEQEWKTRQLSGVRSHSEKHFLCGESAVLPLGRSPTLQHKVSQGDSFSQSASLGIFCILYHTRAESVVSLF